MQELNMQALERYFNIAINAGLEYIAVKIQMEGFDEPEIIINSYPNFRTKLAYYQKAYNDDLTLKAFNGIKIIDITYADSFKEIESKLLDY